MPLLDHFHPPLAPRRQWQSFHVTWAAAIAEVLNNELLPDDYFAEEHASFGPRIEIDVATFTGSPPRETGGGATAVATYAPPVPTLAVPAAFPDDFEVRVYGTANGGAQLVAAIELVSPANKDRQDTRQAFSAKCAGYLAQGVSLMVVDVVTNRGANLHAEVMALLGSSETGLPADADLYAVAYRPIVRDGSGLIEVWPEAFEVGSPLPRLPLALSAELCVPIDLEATYTLTCQRKRIP
jgi:hypothetical protein